MSAEQEKPGGQEPESFYAGSPCLAAMESAIAESAIASIVHCEIIGCPRRSVFSYENNEARIESEGECIYGVDNNAGRDLGQQLRR